MRILQVCSKPPNPASDGGAMAMNVLTHGLIELGVEVNVLTMSTHKHLFNPDKISEAYKQKTKIESVFVDTRIKPHKAFLNLFSSSSYNISRFYSTEFENKLISILQKTNYDIIQLETLFTTPYINCIKKHSKAKIVLRSHNIEYKIWKRLASSTTNPIKRAYLRLLANRINKYEISILNEYDAVAAITSDDAKEMKELGSTKPIITIPFGINTTIFNKNENTQEEFPSLFHLGAMNWRPNEAGVKWFLENVWETIHKKHPHLKFYLAGRYMPAWLKNLKKENLVIIGEVDDALKFISSKGIMIVPLLSGGGMRVKIIEGMAARKTIISTSIGAEGIPYENGKHILIADTPDEFVKSIDTCLQDVSLYKTIGRNAQKLVEDHFDNKKICSSLLEFYKKL